jgi:hypothetical protein
MDALDKNVTKNSGQAVAIIIKLGLSQSLVTIALALVPIYSTDQQ